MPDMDLRRAVLSSLRDRASTASKQHPLLHHMLVLPAGESILIPGGPGCHPLGHRRPPGLVEFGCSRVATPLPPTELWPANLPPWRAVVAEHERFPHRAWDQEPYRVHLFFGGDDEAGLGILLSLAKEILSLRRELRSALFGPKCEEPDGLVLADVLYESSDCVHGEDETALDAWLSTMHWWAWKATDSPVHCKPRIIIGSSAYDADPVGGAMCDKLSYSYIDLDVLSLTTAILDLFMRFLDEPPAIGWGATYPPELRPDEMTPAEVAAHIDRFIGAVEAWQKRDARIPPMVILGPEPDPHDDLRRDDDQRRAAEWARARRYGAAIAAAMERLGHDSTGVLRTLDLASDGAQPHAVSAIWSDVKVLLLRTAMHLRSPAAQSRQPLHGAHSKWLERPFDSTCTTQVERDSATIQAVRRVLTDWDGTNWGAVRQCLRNLGRTPDEITAMTVFDIRMAFAVGQRPMLKLMGRAETTTSTVIRVLDGPGDGGEGSESKTATGSTHHLDPGLRAGAGEAASRRRFAVAFSFPGERREYLCRVDEALCGLLGRERVFYDNRFKPEIARPDADTYLQRIYHDETDLVVVFLCADYERKQWCGLEWRAIRDLIKKKQSRRIMYFLFDDGTIPGFLSIDGYIDANTHTPEQAALLINERLLANEVSTA